MLGVRKSTLGALRMMPGAARATLRLARNELRASRVDLPLDGSHLRVVRDALGVERNDLGFERIAARVSWTLRVLSGSLPVWRGAFSFRCGDLSTARGRMFLPGKEWLTVRESPSQVSGNSSQVTISIENWNRIEKDF